MLLNLVGCLLDLPQLQWPDPASVHPGVSQARGATGSSETAGNAKPGLQCKTSHRFVVTKGF